MRRLNINYPKLFTALAVGYGTIYMVRTWYYSYNREHEKQLMQVAKKQIYDEYPELRPYVNLDKDDFDEYDAQYQKIMKK